MPISVNNMAAAAAPSSDSDSSRDEFCGFEPDEVVLSRNNHRRKITELFLANDSDATVTDSDNEEEICLAHLGARLRADGIGDADSEIESSDADRNEEHEDHDEFDEIEDADEVEDDDDDDDTVDNAWGNFSHFQPRLRGPDLEFKPRHPGPGPTTAMDRECEPIDFWQVTE